MDTTTNATKKWSARPRPAVTIPPSYEFPPSNPAAIPCNPRRAPTPRSHQITNADEMSKTPTTRPAVTIVRNAPEVFKNFAELTQECRKLESKETMAATINYLLRICNLRSNRRPPRRVNCAKASLSNLWSNQKIGTWHKHFVTFPVFLDSRFVVIS